MKTKNGIWHYLFLTIGVILILANGCKKDDPSLPTDLESQPGVEEAFPGVQGQLQDFVINGRTITVKIINGKYVFQGDIILTKEQLTSGSEKGAGINPFIQRWPCEIYYTINDNVMYRKNDIVAAIEHYEANTPLKFVLRTEEKNYVEFMKIEKGCYSYLGMIGGRQEICFSDSAKTGNIMHEIGHAIGLIHEHSREDAYLDIHIFLENIDLTKITREDAEANFSTIQTKYKTSSFDFFSIMLYPSDAFSKPGAYTITKLDGSVWPANRTALSVGDIDVITSIYTNDIVQDIDGNLYKTTTIGTQIWMAENLKVTRLNDGTDIPNITAFADWEQFWNKDWPEGKEPYAAYCWYDNDEATYRNPYGALYNWYAVKTGKLCPIGWHVPSHLEWDKLVLYLEPTRQQWGEADTAGNRLREVGIEHWASPNTGATDEVCFNALPGGLRAYRQVGGTGPTGFKYNGQAGWWWTSKYGFNGESFYFMIYEQSQSEYGNTATVDIDFDLFGFSVRCVQDTLSQENK